MPIPDFQSVFLPLLKLVAKHGQLPLRDAIQMISDEFHLTEDERRTLLPSGKALVIQNRVGWARTYLKKAGLLAYPQRGVLELTDKGKKVLTENPNEVRVKYLRQFPEFLAFCKRRSNSVTVGGPKV